MRHGKLMLDGMAISANASLSNSMESISESAEKKKILIKFYLRLYVDNYLFLFTWMLREYIDAWIGHIDWSCPAWRCPGATAGFPGSPPDAAPPVSLPLVWLGRVGLWWLEPGRCTLTDSANLLSHPGSLAWGRSKQTPLRASGSHSPKAGAAWPEYSSSIPSPPFFQWAKVKLARVSSPS